MKNADLLAALKAIISLLSVLLALSILLMFTRYKDAIISSNNYQMFMALTVAGLAFLLVLVYLVNNSTHNPKRTSRVSKSRKKK